MASRGAILAAALLGGLVLLWWMLRKRDDTESIEPETKPPKGLRYDVEQLKTLPNYRPYKESAIRFATHEEFIRAVDQEMIKRFPRKGARSILIAHAVTGGGWHVYTWKPPLVHYNLWGQTCSSELVAKGVPFTIMKPRIPTGKHQAFRAFSSMYEALMEGYIPNIKSYIKRFGVSDPVEYLDTRGDDITKEEIAVYVGLINHWFQAKEQTVEGQAIRTKKWFNIYNKWCKGKLL